MIHPRNWLLAGRFCSLLFALASAAAAADSRPNIIIIQTDDQGYDDMALHQPPGAVLKTPTMDALGRRSVQFENFYTAPLCAPTRAMVLTGRHHLNAGVWGVHGGQDFVALDETIIAEPMRAAGYNTGFIGKWHSGKTAGYYPWNRGFDDAYMAKLYVFKDNPLLHNGRLEPTTGWTEKTLADLAIRFIDRQDGKKPFFLYYCPLTCHGGVLSPDEGEGAEHGAQNNAGFNAPPEFVAPYRRQGLGPELSKLYGMLTFLDGQLGRVLTDLQHRGLAENTLILFLGDNGPTPQTLSPAEWKQRNPSQMRGAKTKVDENGIRSFLFASMGARFQPHTVKEMATVVDLFPTVLDFSGVTSPENPARPRDGFSLRPLLEGAAWNHAGRLWYQIELLNSSGLGVDSMPAVDPDLDTVRPQPLLTLGDPANTIDQAYMVRQGWTKLTKGTLYDLSAPDGHRETHVLHDPATQRRFEGDFAAWWRGVVGRPNSFQKPTLVLSGPLASDAPDFASRTNFYAYQCVAARGDDLTVDNHAIFGFSHPGDQLLFRTANPGAGTYAVTLRFRGKLPTGAVTVALTTSAHGGSAPQTRTASSDGSNQIVFPGVPFPAATADEPGRLAVEVTASKYQPKSPVAFIELRVVSQAN